MLSASLIPVDTTPWWNVSPGCLLSPPSQLYTNSTPAPIPLSFGATNQGQPRVPPSSVIHRVTDFPTVAGNSHGPFENASSATASVIPPNDPQWFMSSDSLAFSSSAMMESTSAPSSPVSRRRRNFKLFNAHPDNSSHHATFKSRQSGKILDCLWKQNLTLWPMHALLVKLVWFSFWTNWAAHRSKAIPGRSQDNSWI